MSVSKSYKINQHHTGLDEYLELQPFIHKGKILTNITVINDSHTASVVSVDLEKLIKGLQDILKDETKLLTKKG